MSEQFSKQNIISFLFFQRNMNEYFNAVKANEMITIFASLLHERRIIVTSSRLSRLTACVQAQYTYLDSNVGSGLTLTLEITAR